MLVKTNSLFKKLCFFSRIILNYELYLPKKLNIMKLLKSLLVLFIAVSIASCSSNNDEVSFTLSNANIAGTYNISSLNIISKITTVTDVAGIPVTLDIASSKSEGDTFQVDFVINENGTYTSSGEYRLVTTISPITGETTTNSEIIKFNDSGSYVLNTTNETIVLTSDTDDFIEGTLNVVKFNENTIDISQEVEEKEGSNTVSLNYNISFIRQ